MGDKKKRSKNKDGQLVLRISKEERKTFIDLCDELDTSAAREVRKFIREFIAQHEHAISN